MAEATPEAVKTAYNNYVRLAKSKGFKSRGFFENANEYERRKGNPLVMRVFGLISNRAPQPPPPRKLLDMLGSLDLKEGAMDPIVKEIGRNPEYTERGRPLYYKLLLDSIEQKIKELDPRRLPVAVGPVDPLRLPELKRGKTEFPPVRPAPGGRRKTRRGMSKNKSRRRKH